MSESSENTSEVAISAELTDSGLKASAKSRFISAIDRLGGNVVDAVGAGLENWNERRKAKLSGEKRLIDAAARYGVEKLQDGDAFSERVFTGYFKKIAREQINKDAVLERASEDLKSSGVDAKEVADGDVSLSEQFLDRIDSYAAQASTEELRERWGKVLAAEIRKPGSFSVKVLRIVDEIDSKTANLFEKVSQFRIGDMIPVKLIEDVNFDEILNLINSGLLTDPGIGQIAKFRDLNTEGGDRLWVAYFEDYALGFLHGIDLPRAKGLLAINEGVPAVEIRILTPEAVSICEIGEDKQESAILKLGEFLSDAMTGTEVRIYKRINEKFHETARVGKSRSVSDNAADND